MGIKKKKIEEIKSQYERDLEERGPNLSSYEDDPFLNMDPVFSDDINAQANNKMIQESLGNAPKNGANPLASIIQKHRENNPSSSMAPKIAGPLGDIIGNARKKSEEIAHDVEERDPVIAKLKKIDELLKKGGTDDSLYTDVNKSQVGYYAKRAKEFLEQQVTKKPESDAERIARMAKETRERGTNQYVPNHANLTEEIKERVVATRNKEKNFIQEDDFRARAKEMAQTYSNVSKTPQKRQDLGVYSVENSSVFGLKATEKFKIEKRMKDQQLKVNISEIAAEFKNQNLTPAKIAELEEKIRKKIEKVQKHKIALAKKEEKVMKLVLETEAKKSSTKIAQLLEQRTVELEMEAQRLLEHENDLEKTIAELKSIDLEKKPRNKVK